MQITHDHSCDVPFPEKVEPNTVNVWVHESGMFATHDYSCPVCRMSSALLSLNDGVMYPCDDCIGRGYVLLKPKGLLKWIIRLLGVINEN